MFVRLVVPRSGLRGSQNIGDEIDVPNAEAIRMIEAGQAVPVREAPEPEKTAASRPRGRKKSR